MNKFKSLLLIMFFVIILSLSKVNALVSNYTLLGKTIYLDAGHGGFDAGAVYNNIYEKNINLQIVKYLEEELIKNGAYVYLTRDGDYDLSDNKNSRKRSDLSNRAKLINDSKCDLYISIHLNATTSSKWRGLQIFYSDVNKENKEVAFTLNDVISKNLSNVREVKKENNYYMYKRIKPPGVLIEAGFISNASDNYILRDKEYQKKLARLISKGIIEYFT